MTTRQLTGYMAAGDANYCIAADVYEQLQRPVAAGGDWVGCALVLLVASAFDLAQAAAKG